MLGVYVLQNSFAEQFVHFGALNVQMYRPNNMACRVNLIQSVWGMILIRCFSCSNRSFWGARPILWDTLDT